MANVSERVRVLLRSVEPGMVSLWRAPDVVADNVCVQLAPYTVGSSLVLSCSLFNMNNLDADCVVKLSTFRRKENA